MAHCDVQFANDVDGYRISNDVRIEKNRVGGDISNLSMMEDS